MGELRKFTDQMGRSIEVDFPPQRIISLVPSQTEFLYDLGLENRVIAQTLFCIHPKQMHQTKPRVGGTKNVKAQVVQQLNPDLIIGNKEENNKADVLLLEQHYPVWMSDIVDLEDACEMMTSIGKLVHEEAKAVAIVDRIKNDFSTLTPIAPKPLNCLYLIWRAPYMAAGKHTFIDDMLKRLGLNNVAYTLNGRYPEVDFNHLATKPDVIFLSSEPYPFKQKHVEELSHIFPQAKIMLVDGELFSWYGSRLLHSVQYFKELLHTIQS